MRRREKCFCAALATVRKNPFVVVSRLQRRHHDKRLSFFWTAHEKYASSRMAVTEQANGREGHESSNDSTLVDDPIKIPILLETDRFLVIDKPAGIPHHNDDGEHLGIVNLLHRLAKRRQSKQVRPTIRTVPFGRFIFPLLPCRRRIQRQYLSCVPFGDPQRCGGPAFEASAAAPF